MESEFSHGMNSIYDHQERTRRYAPPSFPSPFQESPTQPGAHTLPPIQSQRPGFDHAASSFEQQHRQQPSIYSTQAHSYPNYAPQVSHPPYSHGIPHFTTSSALLSSPAPVMPMQGYGGPASTGFPQIRPMPAPSSSQPSSISHAYAPSSSFGFPNPTDENDLQPRTHVVGSQGRRGILPSAEGKPAAVASNGNTAAKNAVIPQKDADGKFPCPHCQKTYLHGKHLKRHLLRHTGDRPYSCFLCNDTFSRSDILKRHFQKCSIRRGNPTGATHLSHSQNHLKKQGAKKPQTPSAINTNFSGVTHASPHSASPLYGDTGLGVGIGSSSSQPQTDGSKGLADGTSSRDQRNFTHPSTGFNRPNYNYLAGQNGPASLPSSGGSTPLTAKGTNHFQQSLSADASQPRMNSYPEINHRPSQSQVSGPHFDGNSFDTWSGLTHGKEEGDNHIGRSENDGNGIKTESTETKLRPNAMSDQHEAFLREPRGGYFQKGTSTPDSINGWSVPNSLNIKEEPLMMSQ